MLCAVCVAGCNKYKTFQDEVAVLNGEYTTTMQSVFAKSKAERVSAMEQAQQQYDEAFAQIAKRWKVNAATSPAHLNFAAMYCNQIITEPYQKAVEEIAAKYKGAFQSAVLSQNNEKGSDVGKNAGKELGMQNVAYKRKAQANGCDFEEVTANQLVSMFME